MTLETIISVEQKGRRGRPRKYPIDTTEPIKQPTLVSNTPTPTTPVFEEKPREERSYKDFFPDLNIKEPLSIVKINNKIDTTTLPLDSLSSTQTTNDSDLSSNEEDIAITNSRLSVIVADNLKSPSNDEYETASEGELTNTEKPSKLPIASFKKIGSSQIEESDQDNTDEEQEQDSHLFQRPENHYIRYIEPSETELFETVEYDMDEQDEVWLQIYNNDRKKENLGEVSGDLFESIIDQLEKEWFDLIKSLPKKTNDEPALPEDSKCAICDDGECENSNAIVFCDGCNLAVHQDCYGIPYIPEGQWLCRKCMVSPENPVSCIFCPGEGGAFKQTTTNQWGHLLCAIWIPEVGLSNSVYMEPIDNIGNVPKSRWKLTCYICRRRHGACIQCDNKHCFAAFHVTCARWARLCMRMKLHGTHYDGVVLKAYCEKHTPRDYKEQVDVEKSVADAQRWFTDPKRKRDHLMPRKRYVDEEDDDAYPDLTIDVSDKKNKRKLSVDDIKQFKKQRRQQAVTQLLPASKAARAHQHQYAAGAPIAPEYILEKLENLKCVRQATNLKKKSLMITSICRYWSLKRESRRGAPLLKRLHLEPWTASASQLKQSEVEKAHKASSMITLRADLEKVRMLSEQVQKRERLKLERIRKQKAYLETILYPIELIIQPILDQFIELDKKELFRYPVTLDIASDYHEIIKTPMSFTDIIEKLSVHRYLTLDEFEHDLSLIWKNSMTYNKSDTSYFKLAQRLEKTMEELMMTARTNYQSLNIAQSGLLDVDIDPEIFSYGDESKNLKINTTAVEKENIPQQNETTPSSSSLSSLSTISSDSTIQSFVKRRASDALDEPPKKRRASSTSTVDEERTKKPAARVTRSKSEKDKRTLRTRSITKDMHHPVKIGKPSTTTTSARKRTLSPVSSKSKSPVEEPIPKRKRSPTKKQDSTTTEGEASSTRESRSKSHAKVKAPAEPRKGRFAKAKEPATEDKETHAKDEKHSGSRSEVHAKSKAPVKTKIVKYLNPKSKATSSSATEETPKKASVEKKKKPVSSTKKSATVDKPQSQPAVVKFENDEIVWARVRGFPPHPARIVDPKKRRKIPKNVLQLKGDEDKVLVEFFQVSEAHTWGWIEKNEIHPFGDPTTDIEMLLLAKRTKKIYRIKEVRKGYKYACGLVHMDPLSQLQNVFPKISQ